MKKYHIRKRIQNKYSRPWICRCGTQNEANDIYCINCGEKLAKHYWVCEECGYLTDTTPCTNCMQKKFLWTCSECNKRNTIFYDVCVYCGHEK